MTFRAPPLLSQTAWLASALPSLRACGAPALLAAKEETNKVTGLVCERGGRASDLGAQNVGAAAPQTPNADVGEPCGMIRAEDFEMGFHRVLVLKRRESEVVRLIWGQSSEFLANVISVFCPLVDFAGICVSRFCGINVPGGSGRFWVLAGSGRFWGPVIFHSRHPSF